MSTPEIVVALNGANPVPNPESPNELSIDTKERAELALRIAIEEEIPLIATVGRAATAMSLHILNTAKELGEPAPTIIPETKSYETVGNAHYSKKDILEPLGLKVVRAVTSDYHQRRAAKTWERVLGPGYEVNWEVVRPNFSETERLKWAAKEIAFGLIEDYLIMSRFGLSSLGPADDAEREARIKRYHPRSPESIWRKVGAKPLADRLS